MNIDEMDRIAESFDIKDDRRRISVATAKGERIREDSRSTRKARRNVR